MHLNWILADLNDSAGGDDEQEEHLVKVSQMFTMRLSLEILWRLLNNLRLTLFTGDVILIEGIKE